jgi:hypothetical protein
MTELERNYNMLLRIYKDNSFTGTYTLWQEKPEDNIIIADDDLSIDYTPDEFQKTDEEIPKNLIKGYLENTLECHNDYLKEIILKGDAVKENSFSNCGKLEEIAMPDTVTTVQKDAFKNCINLKKVRFSQTLDTIAAEAFADTALEKVKIPKSVKVIDRMAFCNHENKGNIGSRVVLPEDLQTLGYKAFWGNPRLAIAKLSEELDCFPAFNDDTFFEYYQTEFDTLTYITQYENVTHVDDYGRPDFQELREYIENLPPELAANLTVIKAAAALDINTIKYLPEDVQYNKELMYKVVRQVPQAVLAMPEKTGHDRTVLMGAFTSPYADGQELLGSIEGDIYGTDIPINDDMKLIKAAIIGDAENIKYANMDDKIPEQVEAIMKLVLSEMPEYWNNVPEEYRKNELLRKTALDAVMKATMFDPDVKHNDDVDYEELENAIRDLRDYRDSRELVRMDDGTIVTIHGSCCGDEVVLDSDNNHMNYNNQAHLSESDTGNDGNNDTDNDDNTLDEDDTDSSNNASEELGLDDDF